MQRIETDHRGEQMPEADQAGREEERQRAQKARTLIFLTELWHII